MNRLLMLIALTAVCLGAVLGASVPAPVVAAPAPAPVASVDSSPAAGQWYGLSWDLLGLAAGLSVQHTGVQSAAFQGVITEHGCAWPRVCFYRTYDSWYGNRPTAAYRDMHYQNLSTAAYNARFVYNSRRDDGVRLYYVDRTGDRSWFCLIPGASVYTFRDIGWGDATVYAIDITDDPSCGYQ